MVSDLPNVRADDHTAQPIFFNRPWKTIGVLMMSDALGVAIGLGAASVLRDSILSPKSEDIAGMLPPVWVLTFSIFVSAGLYTGVALDEVEEVRRLCLSVSLVFLALLSATFFLHDLSMSRVVYLLAWFLCTATIPILRSIARGSLSSKSWWGSPVAILGFGSTGQLVLQRLLKKPGHGLRPFAVFDDNPMKLTSLPRGVVSGPLTDCNEIASNHKLPYGIVCMPHISREELLALIGRYGQCFGHLLVIPNLIGMTSLGISARNIGGIVGLEVRQELLRPRSRRLKRCLDLALILLLAPIIAPLVAVAGLLIILESPGPVFYKSTRVGYGGRHFTAWKLRSMVINGDNLLTAYFAQNPFELQHWNVTQKLKRDPRITRTGRILRRTSIDELPQLWNVLIGEMSIVGPRPIQEDQIPLYGPSFNLYKQVKPGITGLWQVSGRNRLPFSERVNLDRYVIQNWSLWLDLYVLALTARAVISAEGAY